MERHLLDFCGFVCASDICVRCWGCWGVSLGLWPGIQHKSSSSSCHNKPCMRRFHAHSQSHAALPHWLPLSLAPLNNLSWSLCRKKLTWQLRRLGHPPIDEIVRVSCWKVDGTGGGGGNYSTHAGLPDYTHYCARVRVGIHFRTDSKSGSDETDHNLYQLGHYTPIVHTAVSLHQSIQQSQSQLYWQTCSIAEITVLSDPWRGTEVNKWYYQH